MPNRCVFVFKGRSQQHGAFRDLVPGVAEAQAALRLGGHPFVLDEACAGRIEVPRDNAPSSGVPVPVT